MSDRIEIVAASCKYMRYELHPFYDMFSRSCGQCVNQCFTKIRARLHNDV